MQSVIEHQSVGRRKAGVEALRRIVSAPGKTGDQLLSIRNYLGRRRTRSERNAAPNSSLSSQRLSVIAQTSRVRKRLRPVVGRRDDRLGASLRTLGNRRSILDRARSYWAAARGRVGGRGRVGETKSSGTPTRFKGFRFKSLGLSGPGELHIAFGASIVLTVLAAAFLLQPGQALHGMMQHTPELSLPSDGAVETLRTRMAGRERGYEASADLELDAGSFLGVDTVEYELRSGDTLSGIAAQNGLRLDTLVSFNRISDARRMRAGDSIKIPNRDGVLHTVSRGESLESIARSHGSSVNALLDANDLESARIDPGDMVFVPEARMDGTELAIILGDAFRWPVRGRISSGFGMRRDPFTGTRRFHNGIDIVNRPGTPVNAAMSGRVVHVENQPGNYGKFVIMRHPRGYQTLYAHLDRITVSSGQYLSQGQRVGLLGNTGRSTGPHLHFSILENGQFIDPMRHLR